MADQRRGDDAATHAPKPRDGASRPSNDRTSGAPARQDAPNYDRRIDGGLAEPTDALNSANDE